jgi:predicted nuclease of predicted toxin-antitoxin system
VKFLLDENLSPKLVPLLSPTFPGSRHVDTEMLHGRPDREIWEFARHEGYIVVSKDDDFRQLSFLLGAPPKVVYLRVGNASTKQVADPLISRSEQIRNFATEADTALLIVA